MDLTRCMAQGMDADKYEDVIIKALGPIPEELETIIEICLPVNKYYHAVEPSHDEGVDVVFDENWSKLSQETINYLKWAEMKIPRGCKTRRAAVTESITWWCWALWQVKQANRNMINKETKAKRAEIHTEPAQEKKRMAMQEIRQYFKEKHPKYHDILENAPKYPSTQYHDILENAEKIEDNGEEEKDNDEKILDNDEENAEKIELTHKNMEVD